MRKTLWLLALWLLAAPASAQMLGTPQTITVVDSGTACVTAPTACATFPVNTSTSVAFDISGTWTGTLTFEGTTNGGVWRTITVINANGRAPVTTATASGSFAVPNGGYVGLRLRATATVTGGAVVSATQGYGVVGQSVPAFPASFTAGDLLYAATPTTVSGIADVALGQVLVSGGVGVVPAYSANPTASTFTANQPNITTVSTDGFIAANATAATVGVPVQQSPRIRLRSNVWNTTVTAANNTNDWWIEGVPVSGTTPSGVLKFASSLNGGAATFPAMLTSSGRFTTLENIVSGLTVQMATNGSLAWGTTSTFIESPSNGQINFVNNAGSASSGFDFGTNNVLKIRTRAQTGYATVDALAYNLAGAPAIVSTAPTVSSGFGSGTAGTIVSGSTAFAFRVIIGTNAGGTTGVIGMPTATNFWNCSVVDQSTPLDITRQTASSASSVTFTTTIAWTTGDVLVFLCGGS